jgi:hypothetical protein
MSEAETMWSETRDLDSIGGRIRLEEQSSVSSYDEDGIPHIDMRRPAGIEPAAARHDIASETARP